MPNENIPLKIPKKKEGAPEKPSPALPTPPTYYESFLAGRTLLTAKDLRLTYLPANETTIFSLHDAGGNLIGAFYIDAKALQALKEGLAWLDGEKQKQVAKS